MTINAALWASSTALPGKAALAFWTAAVLFHFCDGRRFALAWQILLAIGGLVCSLMSSPQATGPLTKWLWVASAAISAGLAWATIWSWMSGDPRGIYEEAARQDPALHKKRSRATQASPRHTFPSGSDNALRSIASLGMLTAATAIAFAVYATLSAGGTSAWLGMIHALASSLLWGVAIFCAVELTFGSSPAALACVTWSGAASVAFICWIGELGVAAKIVLSPLSSNLDLPTVAMARLFAITVLLMDFIVWIIPQRVANFKRTGKASAWTSLTLAAWIAALGLAVLCALPSQWPWNSL